MRRPIDVAFLAGDGCVLRVDLAVPPRRIRMLRGARAVIEAPAGRFDVWAVAPGRRLALHVAGPVARAEDA
jgi:uncharacterized membrane protein (UPF0127 family)